MTAELTMIPKSTAPTDKRFASSPRKTRIMMLKNKANGMLMPTMMALRRLPRKTHCTMNTKRQPKIRLCRTVVVVTDTRVVRS